MDRWCVCVREKERERERERERKYGEFQLSARLDDNDNIKIWIQK